jgi:RimJ/RimL family protein N-acetyltransferase
VELRTERLTLTLQTRADVESMVGGMSAEAKAQLSPAWLARLRAATDGDPWTHPFSVVCRATGAVVGACSFKAPPDGGVVEIAYGIDPGQEGRGYATEAARALVEYALTQREVRAVRAHTLPGGVASQRVLAKCGFAYVGDVTDPEDGVVSRFERSAPDVSVAGRGDR